MPKSLRSPRQQALKIGTDRSGFPKDVPYDASAGAPSANVSGSYQRSSKPSPAPAAVPSQNPFRNLR